MKKRCDYRRHGRCVRGRSGAVMSLERLKARRRSLDKHAHAASKSSEKYAKTAIGVVKWAAAPKYSTVFFITVCMRTNQGTHKTNPMKHPPTQSISGTPNGKLAALSQRQSLPRTTNSLSTEEVTRFNGCLNLRLYIGTRWFSGLPNARKVFGAWLLHKPNSHERKRTWKKQMSRTSRTDRRCSESAPQHIEDGDSSPSASPPPGRRVAPSPVLSSSRSRSTEELRSVEDKANETLILHSALRRKQEW